MIKAFKDSVNNRLAIIICEYVYYSNLEGEIYKHEDSKKFDSTSFTEKTEFPVEIERAQADYWAERDTEEIDEELSNNKDLNIIQMY